MSRSLTIAAAAVLSAFAAAGAIHSMLVGVHAAYAIDPKLTSREAYSEMLLRSAELLLQDLRS